MKINMDKLIKLNDLVTTSFRRKHIIVLNPEFERENNQELNANVIYDKAEWKIPQGIQSLIYELSQNDELSSEEKILLIYEQICKDYIYDDNLISYIQKIDDDSYALPDWYGRDVDEEWEKNREHHNRRVCYEVSRYLATSLTELLKNDEKFNVTILWDKGLTHYFVGLTCGEYSITLDVDDFNNIKDLTRIKAGLTAEGIVILEDNEGQFKRALDKFNSGRSKDAIKKMQSSIFEDIPNIESSNADQIEEPDSIVFLKNAIEILKNKYDIDSQGIYEYIKEIVDVTLGPQARKKIWKEIKGNTGKDTRYIRCLLLDVNSKKYIVDVDKMLLRRFDEQELKMEDSDFIPYKDLLNEDVINYRSRKEERYNGI